MTILELNKRLPEVGRIRIGSKIATRSGKQAPSKLEFFRLTSPDLSKLEQAAEMWGGDVIEWPEAPTGRQWQLFTTSSAIPVMVPPTQMAFSQFLETWSAGGCSKRCDGEWEQISDGPCRCKPNGERECKPHTRLSLILPDLGGLGLWRLDTSGWNGSAELAGTIQVIEALGILLPAKLRLDQRTAKKDGQTLRFAVPVLDVDIQGRTLMAMAHKQQALVLPQFSHTEPLSQDVRGQMMALARQKGLSDDERHRLSEGQSWGEGGGLSNAEGQRILAAMRDMPDAKVLDAKLYTPADPETEPVTDAEWQQVAGQPEQPELSPEQEAQREYRETAPGAFDCPAVHEDGVRQCINTRPHQRAHVWEEVKGKRVSA